MVSKLAADGMSVSADLADAIEKLNITLIPPDLRSLVTQSDNVTKLKQGDLLKQPLLAETLKVCKNF